MATTRATVKAITAYHPIFWLGVSGFEFFRWLAARAVAIEVLLEDPVHAGRQDEIDIPVERSKSVLAEGRHNNIEYPC